MSVCVGLVPGSYAVIVCCFCRKSGVRRGEHRSAGNFHEPRAAAAKASFKMKIRTGRVTRRAPAYGHARLVNVPGVDPYARRRQRQGACSDYGIETGIPAAAVPGAYLVRVIGVLRQP